MIRENPALTFWERLLPHYLGRDWDSCIRELRPVLDADEDALVPRLLCAGFHLAAGQPVLALVQYETLLPLAVGQGEFFAAVAVQKRLDLLHPRSVTHARRYEVLQRWFSSLGLARGSAPPGDLSAAALLALDSAAFTRMIEACTVEGLDPSPRTITGDLRGGRVALYGKASWALRIGEGLALLEGTAERSQTIAVDPGETADARLVITAEWPTEFLLFDAASLSEPAEPATPRATATKSKPVAAAPPPPPSASLSIPEAPDVAATAHEATPPAPPAARTSPSPSSRPPRPAPPVTARPQPDPRFEPFVAAFKPAERRRESRVAINLESGVARIGLVDTRVAPIGGRLTQLGLEFVELVFSRADLRHLRTRLEGSCLGLEFNLGPHAAPLLCTGRVRWTTALGSGPDTDELKIEIEILPLRHVDRERLAVAAQRLADGHPGAPPARAA